MLQTPNNKGRKRKRVKMFVMEKSSQFFVGRKRRKVNGRWRMLRRNVREAREKLKGKLFSFEFFEKKVK